VNFPDQPFRTESDCTRPTSLSALYRLTSSLSGQRRTVYQSPFLPGRFGFHRIFMYIVPARSTSGIFASRFARVSSRFTPLDPSRVIVAGSADVFQIR